MPLEPRNKELAAIGASIGCNCRPCIEHHIAAGREAGLSDAELERAVVTAQAVESEAVELLRARVDELLGGSTAASVPTTPPDWSKADELVALGASLGANSHALLGLHMSAALTVGLSVSQVRSALKMAQFVQQKAAEITAGKVTGLLSELTTSTASELSAVT